MISLNVWLEFQNVFRNKTNINKDSLVKHYKTHERLKFSQTNMFFKLLISRFYINFQQ